MITGLIEGNPIEQILATLHDPRILKKRDAIERAICGELGENGVFIIRQSLESIKVGSVILGVRREELYRKTSVTRREISKVDVADVT